MTSRTKFLSTRNELAILALILLIFSAATLISLDGFPVHIDEVGYTDPAASYVLGHGFTSGAWYGQNHNEFWSGNVPLHQFALIPWFQSFGFSQLASRSINVLYIVLSCLLLWDGLRRSGFLHEPMWRLCFIGFLLCSYSVILTLAYGRPDAITFMVASAAYWGLCLNWKIARRLVLAISGFVAVWAGLQLVAVLAFAGIVAVVVWRWRFLPEVISLGFGGFLGTLALVGYFGYHGTLDDFIASVRGHTAGRSDLQGMSFFKLRHRLGGLSDPSLILVGVAMVIAAIAWFFNKPRLENRSVLLGFIGLVGVPVWMAVLGVFPQYYAWFAILPATMALFRLYDRSALKKTAFSLSLATVILAALVGFPRVFFNVMMHRSDQVNEKSELFVKSVLRSDDYAIIAKQAYFGTKPLAKRTFYIQWYMDAITDEDKTNLSVAIMDETTFQRLSPEFGGKWHPTGESISLPQRNLLRFPWSDWFEKNPVIPLHVYRRG